MSERTDQLPVVPYDAAPLEHCWGYVSGHDTLIHACKRDGTTLCGMGRSQSYTYFESAVVTCLRCHLLPWRMA